MKKPELIVALDVETLEKAQRLVEMLVPAVRWFKIGSQLFTAYGPDAVKMVGQAGGSVFLDLKFHDIPHTVSSAVASGVQRDVRMMTVHTKGGVAMLQAAATAAVERARELKISKPFIVGVTRLTSDESTTDTLSEVLAAARLAQDSGLDGVVCSVQEAAAVRKQCGKSFIIVTPGIRPAGAAAGDQKRTATVEDAVSAGSDYLVVGRPILEASDPGAAAREIIRSLHPAS